MSEVFFTSDTHFSHRLVAVEKRGFSSIEEHDEAIVQNWNSVVGFKDVVWHLGDVGMGRYTRFAAQLWRLNGQIHLVTGNHDECWPGHRDSFRHQGSWLNPPGRFESIQAFARRRIDGHVVLMSHFPYHGDSGDKDRHEQYRLRNRGEWLLHGHTHQPPPAMSGYRQLSVGLDAWELRPVSLEWVRNVITSQLAREEEVRARRERNSRRVETISSTNGYT